MKKSIGIGAVSFIGIFLFSQVAFAASTSSLLPNSDGNYLQWTPSTGVTHFTLIDESSCNGTTDYNFTNTVGNRDSYGVNLGSIPNNATITAIALVPCASRNTAGGVNPTMNVFYRYNSADSSDSGAYSLTGTTPTNLATTTFSSLALTKTSTSTLETGAVLSAGTKGARLSRIATVITYTPAAPTVTTGTSTATTSTSFVLPGSANPNGAATTGWFRYATTTDPGTCDDSFGTRAPTSGGTSLGSGTTSVNFTRGIKGLTANTTYYYCAIASSTSGTSFGSVQNFTTLPPPSAPSVTTNAATAVATTSSTLQGSANPNGDSSTGWFRYATTTDPGTCDDTFGTRTPTSGGTSLGAGTSSVNYSRPVTGLTPATTYYYCALASNTGGTATGTIMSFTTLTQSPPTVTTNAPASTTATSSTLQGSANPNGAATTGWFRYATTTDPGTCDDTFGTRTPTSGGTSLGAGTSSVNYSRFVSGLTPSTTYYYCALASNNGGIATGTIVNFTTAP